MKYYWEAYNLGTGEIAVNNRWFATIKAAYRSSSRMLGEPWDKGPVRVDIWEIPDSIISLARREGEEWMGFKEDGRLVSSRTYEGDSTDYSRVGELLDRLGVSMEYEEVLRLFPREGWKRTG